MSKSEIKDKDKPLCPHCKGRGGITEPNDWPMGVQECFECFYPWSQYTRNDKTHVARMQEYYGYEKEY